MTFGELALITLALLVIAAGGIWLHAWWLSNHPKEPPKQNGDWPAGKGESR